MQSEKGSPSRARWTGRVVLSFTTAAGLGLVAAQVFGIPGGATGGGQTQLPTTPESYFQPGTQPDPTGKEIVPIWHSNQCVFCHGTYLVEEEESYAEPWDGWVNSMMAQSARDPIWHAAVTIANQDAAGAGEFCIRCHAPAGWLAGRSASGNPDDLHPDDFDGINCHFCHRMVDPVFTPESPSEDEVILAALEHPPMGGDGNARFVIDPASVRRGPFDDVPSNLHEPDPIIYSPFHRDSALCGTCHDVSNPIFVRQSDGSYALGEYNQPHPTQDPHEMIPEQRTYSEWLASQFADGGVAFPDGRFGGNHPTGVMQSCQDCHMPKKFTGGCFAWEWDPFFPRPDMPMHHFAGANTWVLGAIYDQYGYESGLNEQSVADALSRTADMLRAAADVEAELIDDELRVRVTNWSGHKLPTGYPEGRRMWLNIQFLDDDDQIVDERGTYDYQNAELDTSDTKVYQAKFGMDDTVAQATGLPAGESFHLVLNNEVLLDNRIPPVGFTNAEFEDIRAAPVGYRYADGQHWDDTHFDVPKRATKAVVTLFYQTTTREYIEFLRDQNVTNLTGEDAYNLWLDHGMSAPLDMNSLLVEFGLTDPSDLNGDGVVNVFDLLILIGQWGACPPKGGCPADLNGDETVDVFDLLMLLSNWG